jgi:virginiamycin B lyase
MAATLAQGSAAAAPSTSATTFDLGPAGYGGNDIAAGPDGNMWFTNNANNSIGVITPKGAVKYFPIPRVPSQSMSSGLFELTAGPDGNMWFTGFYDNVVGKVTALGVVTLYPVPLPNANPYGITAGVDGNLWFTLDSANAIGRITPDGVVTLFPIPVAGSTSIVVSSTGTMSGYSITAGPLDSLWFTIPMSNLIGRITVAGVVTTFQVTTTTAPSTDTSTPTIGSLTTGVNGNIYFTQNADSVISGMTPTGAITNYPLPTGAGPTLIAPGPANTLWFNEMNANALGRLVVPGAKTPGTITQMPLRTANTLPFSVATGPDGNIWFIGMVNSENTVQSPSNVSTLTIGKVPSGYATLLSAKVTGTGTKGSTLTCAKVEANTWTVFQTRYQWLRDGRVMPGKRGKSYVTTKADVGTRISCEVSVTYAPNLNQLGATAKAVTIRP